ncbi:MAG: UDP-N-acetylmuramoyl-L-alanyl-D-glutamate--2,6-diaminopimelate ligase [Pseudomonadota bacterium]
MTVELKDLVQRSGAHDLTIRGDSGGRIDGLTADSRDVTSGFLFAALPGTQVDGARFVPMACDQGAAAVLLPRDTAEATMRGIPDGVAVLLADDPRRALAKLAAAFYAAQPETIVAVTGTNGKTSVAAFVRQLWAFAGKRAASLGTVGLVTPDRIDTSAHTTPEPVTLHRMLHTLAGEGITHAALEASSHGLQQRRLDGVQITAAAFTNISRDHLDYHPTFEDYFSQKLRLFEELVAADGVAVVDADSPGLEQVCAVAKARGLRLLTTGRAGADVQIARITPDGLAQQLTLVCGGETLDVRLPLVGGFQASNVAVAVGLCVACGATAEDIIPGIASLEGARGRLEPVGQTSQGAGVFVDYAHTPDAISTALSALRPYASGRLIAVFGCGGDRDPGKRPEMGRAAAEGADVVIVTDDNPRTENAAAIRASALSGAGDAQEIGDRAEAIAQAIAQAKAGDVILIAGKGHETGQEINGVKHPFVDHDAAAAAIAGEDYRP